MSAGTVYGERLEELRRSPCRWLVTGAAGFIGSGLVERLLEHDQEVVGLDNFSTGKPGNLDDVRERVGLERWGRFRFIEGDIRDPDACAQACRGVRYVLHQAALGSVPRSVEDPVGSHQSNVDGTLNVLLASRDQGVARVVLASSSSVYGDDPGLPKVEARTGRPLSPYAATKVACEAYAHAFTGAYGLPVALLRYFNVFGPRQDPDGPYAAVIPRWIGEMLRGDPVVIFGDGETSRDFCYLENAIQANLLAATSQDPEASGAAFNVSYGEKTTLNELFRMIRDRLASEIADVGEIEPVYEDFRPGDIRHSLADLGKATALLGYRPTHSLADGLDEAMDWYVRTLAPAARARRS